MNVETLINNDEYKIIFLKAILLGINYGKSDDNDFYTNNIKSEINKIYDKLNNPEIIRYNNIIKKNESNIINLEYQKNNILSNIQKLSHSNYGSNHSKINLLRMTLQNIQLDIERLKFNIKKTKELKEKFKFEQKYQHIQNNIQNNTHQLIQNQNQQHKTSQQNNNLVGELERTLDNLSNLFV
jgi:hypothetical protein